MIRPAGAPKSSNPWSAQFMKRTDNGLNSRVGSKGGAILPRSSEQEEKQRKRNIPPMVMSKKTLDMMDGGLFEDRLKRKN